MKIAHVVSTFPPYHGGMGNVAYQMANKLSNLKYNVTVFTPTRSFFDQDLVSYFKIHKLISFIKYGNAAMVYQLFLHLWRYQIIHLHYPFIGACMPIILLKYLKGKKQKLILHYHMDLVGQGWKSYIYKLINFFHLPLLVKLADHIIVTSTDYLQQSLLAKYQSKYNQKFVEVPNGVDVDFFKPKMADSGLITHYDLRDKKVILFVGGLDSAHYFKGVNYLLKAIQLLQRKDVKLIIVGEGDLKKVYIDLAESFGINDQVIFTGYVPDSDLVKFYNLCDFLVLPSIDKSEAFGMVLLEAMSCAKPVIAADLPGVRKVVAKKVDGRLVKARDSERLAEQINYFLNRPDQAVVYGQAGRKKVIEKYSWSNIVNQIAELYQS